MLPGHPKVSPAIYEKLVGYKQVFMFLGLERGGHHAVKRWLHAQFDGAGYHAPAFNFINNWRALPLSPTDQDDLPIHGSLDMGQDADLTKSSHAIDRIPVVVVVRDVRNMMASRLKMGQFGKQFTGPMALPVWAKYAKQVLGDCDYLDGRCLPIFYDKWFADVEYRREVADALAARLNCHYNFTDSMINRIPHLGGGSSFDKMDLQGKAQEMNVLNRYKEYPFYKTKVEPLLHRTILELNTRLHEEL